MTTLYKKDHRGAMRFWSIESDYDMLVMEYGQVGGEVQEQIEQIDPNMVRDTTEQIEVRMRSRINKKMDNGYKHSQDEAELSDNTNTLGYKRPMLATKFSSIKSDIDYQNSIYQYKYDGHRCLITNDCGVLTAYSRGGKLITSIQHILDGIKIPEGVTIDGELYSHGQKLQTISSWVKRLQPNTLKIKYHCYDVACDAEYTERRSMIDDFEFGANAYRAPSLSFNHSIKNMLINSRDQGYEGLIIRIPKFAYEDGKRSKGLIKVKHFLDDEFKVTRILESKDGWAILECTMDNGNIFTASAPGNMGLKRYVLDHKNQFIGKYVRVEYAGLTIERKPSQPIATMWRDKLNE